MSITTIALLKMGYEVGSDGVARKTGIAKQAEGPLVIHISGQTRGGKNGVLTTRSGHRYPNREWALWRDEKVAEVIAQLPRNWKPIDQPINIRLDYVAGDRRRRDMPAIIDSVFHICEKALVCLDDTLIWVAQSTRTYDKERAGVTITFLDPPTNHTT